MLLDADCVEYARLGGAFLGGGGGGSMEEGKKIGELAVRSGTPTLARLDDLPDEATLVTVSAVGAPGAPEVHVEPEDYVTAVQLLRAKGILVAGLITSENGGLATLNGWFQSAILGIPVVDAACNGRAHPMGLMGSMGLHKDRAYVSIQTAAGGERRKGRHLEVTLSGNLTDAARMIRQAAVLAGGMVAVARNPASVAYARENAAVGAISQAIEIGRLISSGRSCHAVLEGILRFLGGGHVLAEGTVENFALETRGGFDVGSFYLRSPGDRYELAFCNEYVSLDEGPERVATFPDLIATLDPETCLPLTSAEIRGGMRLVLLYVPKQRLKLGAGMRDPVLFEPLQEITGREIMKYL
jgi:DUF917 family protein